MAEEPTPTYQKRIIRDPKILVGTPVVKGTRISVELVLAHLASNPNLDELFAAYPELTIEDVQACLDYAKELVGKQRDHRRRVRKPSKADQAAGAAPSGSLPGPVKVSPPHDQREGVKTMERDKMRARLFAPVSAEELARRQALVKEILANREKRNIAPLTTADLVHQVREEEYRSYDDRR